MHIHTYIHIYTHIYIYIYIGTHFTAAPEEMRQTEILLSLFYVAEVRNPTSFTVPQRQRGNQEQGVLVRKGGINNILLLSDFKVT